jgi:hypothetical protein
VCVAFVIVWLLILKNGHVNLNRCGRRIERDNVRIEVTSLRSVIVRKELGKLIRRHCLVGVHASVLNPLFEGFGVGIARQCDGDNDNEFLEGLMRPLHLLPTFTSPHGVNTL